MTNYTPQSPITAETVRLAQQIAESVAAGREQVRKNKERDQRAHEANAARQNAKKESNP